MAPAADLIARVRARAGLTQRELALKSGTSAAAICQYETGQRIPRVDTLRRIVRAAGATLDLSVTWPEPQLIDLARNARVLEDVLGLADALPHRSAPTLEYPRFAELAC
jgi:transcriptional regulator with XRE-family HTH domain